MKNRTHPIDKQNIHYQPSLLPPYKHSSLLIGKITECPIFTVQENLPHHNYDTKGKQIVVDQLACHIHHADDSHLHHIEHHIGEEAFLPSGLESLRKTLDTRIKNAGEQKE